MARRGFVIILSIIGAAVVFSVAGFALLYLLIARGPVVPDHATLRLRIGGDLAEVAPTDVVSYVRGVRTPTVRAIVDDLRKAAVDPRIGAVLLEPTGFDTPFWGKVQELRDAVLDFRRSGKPAVAYLEDGGQAEYYLATACDRVFLLPSSPLDLRGSPPTNSSSAGRSTRSAPIPDMLHIGEYKTAINQLHREGVHAGAPRDGRVAEPRRLRAAGEGDRGRRGKKPEAEVRALIDQGPFLPEDALRAGLVDDLAYEDEVDDKARAALGRARAHSSSPTTRGSGPARSASSGGPAHRGPLRGRARSPRGRSGFDPINGPGASAPTR